MIGDELAKMIEPTIVGLGYELSDIEVKLNERDGIVRIYIDKLPDGVGMEDCEAVSRQVSALLDVEDPIPGNYTLEVSSPGLDRRLTKLEHFERFLEEVVRIKLRFPQDGRRNFRGTLKAANAEKIDIEVDGEMFELPLATIESARLVPTL
jgi:ribosome maturation factor RimP